MRHIEVRPATRAGSFRLLVHAPERLGEWWVVEVHAGKVWRRTGPYTYRKAALNYAMGRARDLAEKGAYVTVGYE
jgi:hypothetical protein